MAEGGAKGITPMMSRAAIASLVAGLLAAGAAHAQPRTLPEALATAYATNPTLQTSRAQLRATDEGVPAALAGWRPQIVGTVNAGRGPFGQSEQQSPGVPPTYSSLVRNIYALQGTVTQPIYTGGKVSATLHRAKNQVFATRAQLLATEETVLFDTVQAYVNVVQDEQILQIDINNEQILTKQLQSTNDRFRVGELTRTDVAQAEAALASATAQRETAEGNLQSARATYEQFVGQPARNLSAPQPLQLPVKTLDAAKVLAARNNPNVVSALFNDAAARDAFDVAYSALMPNVNVQFSAFRSENQVFPGLFESGGQILGNLSIPIYQGGSEYSGIRQARQQEIAARKQLEDQRRTAVQQATSAWEQLVAARASIASNRSAVRANEIAVEGLEREALVGTRTTLDVLIGIQQLLNAQTALVQSLAALVNASYQVAQGVGRLTARDLGLNVPLYDDKAYYNAVRDLWIGTGDYATNQPGR
jgi:outer membrane protein